MGIVCDSLGGHSFGEIASNTVCNTIADFWMKNISMQDRDSKVKLACKKVSCTIDKEANFHHHAITKTGCEVLPLQKLKVADLIVKSATFFLSSTFYLNSFDVLILLAPI